MTKRKPKNQQAHEQPIEIKKTTHEKSKLAKAKLPFHFPFQNLRCLTEHREIFEGLLGGK
ncbi:MULTISPECIES: hypothetical protein [Candidatus Protochlamydia]|uniref:Uncharacterized protein n=1 Tax=Candidatus Protochlamydia amoebophila TaxID=362787 RepID=A0A0C1H958_9BACT|nr:MULTISPECIES: hypothetical protein [Protochlamydia]KIC71418.1 hypothetical protein DB44_DT00530 [Candidatus Protochlamydia amoebophila]